MTRGSGDIAIEGPIGVGKDFSRDSAKPFEISVSRRSAITTTLPVVLLAGISFLTLLIPTFI